MAFEPRTLHPNHTEADKPCIHFGDQNNQALQVHYREDGQPGFGFAAAYLHPLFGVIQVWVDLTPGQVGELMTEKHRLIHSGVTEARLVRGPRCAPSPAAAVYPLCPGCHLTLPATGVCDDCG
jgi:hypothetical protein